MKYRFIYENRLMYRLEKMCKVLEVSRSGYHKHIRQLQRGCKLLNRKIIEQIKEIFARSHDRYGSRRIQAELRSLGIICNRKRICRVMRGNGLKAKSRRRFKVTTKSNHKNPVSENLVKQNFSVSEPNKLWVSDITYIWTLEGWLYLTVIMDIYSRRIVGWSMSERLFSEIVKGALIQALSNRQVGEKMIFHSDRGSQYASKGIRKILKANGIIQSMSGKGNCYDNAVAESFFHTLKTELIYFEKYSTREEARRSIFEYIEIFYNRQRRHSALNYLSPVEFENNFINLAA